MRMTCLAVLALACTGDKSTGDSATTGDTGDTTPTTTTSTPDARVDTILGMTGDAANGSTLYSMQCAGCHGLDGGGNTTSGYPDLTSAVPMLTREQIVSQMMFGAGDMDAYDFLKNQDMADILAHLETSWGPALP